MGIDVSRAKAVSINEQHEHGVDTSVKGNPTTSRLGKLPLVHVFRRNQRGNIYGDGNPLIYALKNLHGYSITSHWEAWLFRRAIEILAKDPDILAYYKVCIPVPSSSPLCSRFAAVVAEHLGIPLVVPHFVLKKTVGAVLSEAQANRPQMKPGQIGDFDRQVEIWAATDGLATYKAKDVPVSIRTLFEPLEMVADAPDLRSQKILIVDDLFATGSSIESMRVLLARLNAGEAGALCFLSGQRGR